MKTAYIFPGQGSQFVGMGKDHYDSNSEFHDLCEQANDILGISLTDVMFSGPEETLKQTEFTQPAIFLHSVALFRSLGVTPDAVAGHSLGEFSALVACGAISFEDAIKIVRKRGLLMQHAGEINPGTMAAVIGLEDVVVEQICIDASSKVGKTVVPANFNSPGQLVISGNEEAIDVALEIFQATGCKLAKKLPVSGAFHSPLMQPAYDGLKDSLEDLTINEPVCPIFSNFTALPTSDPSLIRSNLLNQLMNPVRWTQTLLNFENDGFSSFIEVGPGKVLQGLVKRTIKSAQFSGHQ
ncbi:MAG TPA: [acyl-carrier-protein] S-malonyltransferase [Bacteroidetes bacterium]|nr:[acyl-carrier-protein] S-malonyltransferase [Bacteroidota bacterium]